MDINTIWQLIAPYVTGLSITGILSTVIAFVLRAMFNKAINKINVEKIANKATEKGIEKVQTITFTHDIQPLVESKLIEIQEKTDKKATEAYEKCEEQHKKVIKILGCLAKYFDNSVGVPEDVKKALKDAISESEVVENKVESIVVVENTKTATKVSKTDNISVDR